MAKKTGVDRRYDSMVDTRTGRGTSRDKIERLRPNSRGYGSQEIRRWYESNGFIQNCVDAPAEDATREWISITTNRDHDDEESGLEGLGISRLIRNRLTELDVQNKLMELIRYSRMYNEGGFMFYGVLSDVPQTETILADPLPAEISRIDFINVFGPDVVSFSRKGFNPTKRYYHDLSYTISGITVHHSRLTHLVRRYLTEERRGISVVETIFDAAKAQDTALWSVTSLLYEMAIWVFKSPEVRDMPPEKIAKLVAEMRAVISTQSSIAMAEDEALERIKSFETAGVKELLDFIFENFSGLAQMPKSRIMGQSQGVITAGEYDRINYFDDISRFQENKLRPIIEKIIGLVIREKDGAVYRALGGKTESLDWEFTFNSLWRIDPSTQADIDLKNAQSDQLRIVSNVLSPSEVRGRRYSDLEEFSSWEEAPLSMREPAIDDTNLKKDGTAKAATTGEK